MPVNDGLVCMRFIPLNGIHRGLYYSRNSPKCVHVAAVLWAYSAPQYPRRPRWIKERSKKKRGTKKDHGEVERKEGGKEWMWKEVWILLSHACTRK